MQNSVPKQIDPPALPQPVQVSHLPFEPRLAHVRGAAALLVLVFHVFHSFFGHWQPQPRFSGLGWVVEGHSGVALFFVLSGYLFMQIALRAKGPLAYGAFLRNRALRIMPLYVIFFVVAISIGRETFRPQDVFYLVFANLGQAPTSAQFITGAAWTIAVEFSFYLVFPFLARFAVAGGLKYLPELIVLLLLLKLGAYWASSQPTHMLYSTVLGRFDQFLVGMWAAQWASGPGRQLLLRNGGVHTGWLVAMLFIQWAILEALSVHASYFSLQVRQPAWVLWPTVEAVGWAAVVVAYVHWRGQLWAGLRSSLLHSGDISYSMYLWHGFVIVALQQSVGVWPPHDLPWHFVAVVCTLVVLGATTVLATLSHRVIERPFLLLRRHYS